MGDGDYPHDLTPGTPAPANIKYTNLPPEKCVGPAACLGNCQTHFFFLFSFLVNDGFPVSPIQMEKDGPFSERPQPPPPIPLLSDTSSFKAKRPSFRSLGPVSRRKILSPGNQEAQDVVDSCSACCPSAFGPVLCLSGRRSTLQPPHF